MATQTGMPSVACDISAADHVRLRAVLRPGVLSPDAVRRQRAAARPNTDASSSRQEAVTRGSHGGGAFVAGTDAGMASMRAIGQPASRHRASAM